MAIISKSASVKELLTRLPRMLARRSSLCFSSASNKNIHGAKKDIPVNDATPPPEEEQAEGQPWSEVWTNEEGTQKSGGQLMKEQLSDFQKSVKESAKTAAEATKEAGTDLLTKVSKGAAHLKQAGKAIVQGEDAKEGGGNPQNSVKTEGGVIC
jgi:hypothetical protein